MLKIVAGKFKGRVLQSPKTKSTRPTQGMLREAVFNICQNDICEALFLDLFAGSGAMGFEALSRGALHVTFVEQNPQAILAIKKNIELLEVSGAVSLIRSDAAVSIDKIQKNYDIIYIDPPYSMQVNTFLKMIVNSKLIKTGSKIFVELRFDPKHEHKAFSDPKLHLKSSRKFGPAMLLEYIVI